MISQSLPLKPAFLINCLSVSSFDHFSSAATSGKKVAEQYLPLNVASITIPCLPTSQSKAFLPFQKLTSSDTPTFNILTSVKWTGSNRSSCSAEMRAYLPRMAESCEGAKVPMHPLRSSLIIQVTKMGTLGSGMVLGQGGMSFWVSLATSTSKQYLQCSFVA